ncbi:hypothetical protein ACH5RR_029097 [Cinchona calisaya]|uniref:Homeobox domain-containing protein n=1 Tax=Cinchona calisaya TaxID=153742 RepID=A0ABD2YSW6_9GENT
MPSRIMIGQLPLIIDVDGTVGSFASSSGFFVGQAILNDGKVPPVAMSTNASETNILEDDFDSKLHGEIQDDKPDGPNHNSHKRRRYHRHTQYQLKELEVFFKLCPHPDETQRKQLSHDFGLDPLQVKVWFQNKLTQMKAYHERAYNARLKVKNEKLRIENMMYKESFSKAFCPSCEGAQDIGDISLNEHQLRVENARLREESSQEFLEDNKTITMQEKSLIGEDIDDQAVQYLRIPLIRNGLALGAQRRVAALARQSERFANAMVTNFPLKSINNTSKREECISDPTGSSIINEPVDNVTVGQPLYGDNSNQLTVLPSGFTILPSAAPALMQGRDMGRAGTVGSLVTCSLQIVIDSVSTTTVSVVKGLVEATK